MALVHLESVYLLAKGVIEKLLDLVPAGPNSLLFIHYTLCSLVSNQIELLQLLNMLGGSCHWAFAHAITRFFF